MMSRTVACLAIWFIGIHGQAGEDGPTCLPNSQACGYTHHKKSCVSSHNIKTYTGRTPEQCAALCNIYGDDCKGFEIFADHGNDIVYASRGDCTLQDSANYDGCDGAYYNTDFYAKGPAAEGEVAVCCKDDYDYERERDYMEEDDDPMSWAIPVAAFSLFMTFVYVFQYVRKKQREQLRMRQQEATLAPDAALQMMQTVGGLPPAAQMQAGGQPAAGYPQAGPVPYGGGGYPQAGQVPYGGGAVIAGQAAVAATVPAAGGYPAAAGGGPAIVGYATAAPVAYGNGAPAVDTSAITMGIVLPAVAGEAKEAPPPVGAEAEKGVQPAKGSSHNFCSGCGARNTGGAFCAQCGAPLAA